MKSDPAARVPLLVLALLVLGLVGVIYAPILGAGFVNYDDDNQIVHDACVTAPFSSNPAEVLLTRSHGYIVPVTLLAQSLLFHVGGGAAWPFHAASLALHAVFCLLVLVVVDRVATRPLALVAALVVAAHPLSVEPVAWATGIKDLLAANFAVLATAGFVALAARSEPPLRTAWALVVLVALLSMLSKPTTVLLGGAWFAFLMSQKAIGARAPRGAFVLAVGVLGLGIFVGALSRFTHDQLKATTPAAWSVALPFSVLFRQAAHVVWPVSLQPTYDVAPAPWFVDSSATLGLAVAALVVVALFRLRRSPLALLSLSVAVAAYLPVSNLLPFARRMSDSYLYLPLAGVVVALAALLGTAPLARSFKLTAAVSAALALLLGVPAHAETRRWKDSESLWAPAVAAMPRAPTPLGGLAAAYLLRGDFSHAVPLYGRAFENGYRADFLNDFGVALASVGRLDEAECVMLEGVFFSPDGANALRNFAILSAMSPRRPSLQPEATLYALDVALYAAGSGKIALDPRSTRRLQARRELVGGGAPKAVPLVQPAWPQGNCVQLRPR